MAADPNISMEIASEYSFPLPPTMPVDPQTQSTRLRSPLPPPYSSLAPSTPPSKKTDPKHDTGGAEQTPVRTIRRTQSATDIQNVAQWKPLPARPLVIKSKGKEGGLKEKPSSHQPVQAGGAKESKVPVASTNGLKAFRALTGLQKGPTPAAEDKEQAKDKTLKKDCRSTKQQITTNDGNTGKCARLDDSPKLEKHFGENGRFTLEQILWLHQNYRGEATFLKAWGFHITREVDRERGLEILQALMGAERSKELQQRQKSQLQVAEQTHHVKAQLSIPPRGKEGLHAIEEEMASCEFHPT
ncbi:hypothetical protein F5Y04DRAFT_290248 [Hypomontagnella monticulosa]|nr:hypothetical protein F5Y04DRAFT_290248 [Hypomontagnella monticulosa]